MRPQPYGAFGDGPDDLGWNDMGDPAPPAAPSPAPVRPALTPEPRRPAQAATEPDKDDTDEDETAPENDAGLDEALAALSSADGRGKAAFTLRLDAARHLKLRLACALNNRSAQQIVTEALDAFLENIPNLEGLAGTLPTAAPRGGGGIKRGVGK